jgi:hypothetical protein
MRVDGCVSSGTSEIFAVTVRDVLTGFGISKALCKTKIDYVHVVLLLADTNEEIIWFDVTMKEMTRVHELNSLKLFKIE